MRNKNATLVFPSKLNHLLDTDKSLSEALIINPKYDDRLFIELQIQYKKNMYVLHIQFCAKKGWLDFLILCVKCIMSNFFHLKKLRS